MDKLYFEHVFRYSEDAVLVCGMEEEYPILYENPKARAVLSDLFCARHNNPTLVKLFGFDHLRDLHEMMEMIETDKAIKDKKFIIMEQECTISVSGHWLEEESTVLLYFNVEDNIKQDCTALEVVSNCMNNIVYVTDIQTKRLIFINQFACDLLQECAEDLIGTDCLTHLNCKFCTTEVSPLEEMLDEDGNILYETARWEWTDEAGKCYQIENYIREWLDKKTVHLQIITDITAQKNHEKALEQYAFVDTMTGLLNRHWGQKKITQMIENVKDEHACLCFIDVDRLKEVNDTFGHDMGDKMLVSVAHSIQELLHKDEVVCRWGGDEFLLMTYRDEVSTLILMETVSQALSSVSKKQNYKGGLTVSYGVVSVDENKNLTAQELITIADNKMYEQKLLK